MLRQLPQPRRPGAEYFGAPGTPRLEYGQAMLSGLFQGILCRLQGCHSVAVWPVLGALARLFAGHGESLLKKKESRTPFRFFDTSQFDGANFSENKVLHLLKQRH